MAKKETIEVTSQDIQDLGVSSIFRWRDCSIGRSSNIELKYEKDTIIDTFGNFVLHSSKRFDKMIVGMSRFCAVLKRSVGNLKYAVIECFFIKPHSVLC
jgi:hypothetical protein